MDSSMPTQIRSLWRSIWELGECHSFWFTVALDYFYNSPAAHVMKYGCLLMDIVVS